MGDIDRQAGGAGRYVGGADTQPTLEAFLQDIKQLLEGLMR